MRIHLSEWYVRRRKRNYLRRIIVATFAIYVCVLSISVVSLNAKNVPEPIEAVAEFVIPVADAYVVPNPCGLDTVVCAGEEPETVEEMIVRLANEYGVDPERAKAIAWCESRYNPLATNQNSSAAGIYQWLKGSWEWIGSPGDRLNAEDNIRAFMKWYPKHPSWWSCDALIK